MSNYWEKRAARRMRQGMQSAEKAAEEIVDVYMRASRYIQKEGRHIFLKYAEETGLTEREAERILKAFNGSVDIETILKNLGMLSPEQRKAFDKWMRTGSVQYRINRLANLQRQIDSIMPIVYATALSTSTKAFDKIIRDIYLKSIFDVQQYAGYGWRVKNLGLRDVLRVMNERWTGKDFSARLWGNTAELADILKRELSISFITGRSELKTWRAVQEKYKQQTVNNIRRLVRTEGNYLANQAQLNALKKSGIKKYVFVAVLDLRTSKICQSMDKTVHDVATAQAGKNLPPMHPWCRSTIRAFFSKEALAAIKQRAWNPETGRYELVPGDMTYQEWYKKYIDPEGKLKKPPKMPEPEEGRNLTREQYNRYKARLGSGFPFTYEEFINMKEDPVQWAAWKKAYKEAGKK